MIVLDNSGYGTERLLHPGNWEFNDIQPWQYHQLPEVLGGGTGYDVRTEGEFDARPQRRLGRPQRPQHPARPHRPQGLQPIARPLGRADEQNGGAE